MCDGGNLGQKAGSTKLGELGFFCLT